MKTDEQLRESLCYRDPRHPEHDPEYPHGQGRCFSDACCHGTHPLVDEILRLRAAIRDIISFYPMGTNRDLDSAINVARTLTSLSSPDILS